MKNPNISYQLGLDDPGGHRFGVSLLIAEPDPSGQILSLPAWIPGSYLVRDFARQIETLQAFDSNGRVAVHKTDSHSWRCAPASGALRIEYRVYAWDLSVRGAHFDESHAFFNGTSLFLAVHGQEEQPCLLRILPPAHASDWQVHTSLPAAHGLPDAAPANGFGSYRAPNFDALIDHPVEIGTPQCVEFSAHGAPHQLVFTGVAPGLDLARIAADAQRICAAQIELFEPETRAAPFLDSASKYVFLVMVTGDGYGGLEHRSSTALITRRADLPTAGAAAPAGYRDFLGLLSHEYFHTWNVKRIKPAAFVPYRLHEPNFTELLWVFEGITSHYDDAMLLRSGVIDEASYLELQCRKLDQVARAGGRHKQSLAQSSFDAWTRYYKQDENSPNALVSYYTKGALLAWCLELLIAQQSAGRASLDDLMRLLWREYGRDFYRGAARGVAEDAMGALITRATGVDLDDFLQRYVYGCDELPLAQLLAASGLELSAEPSSKLPDLGVRSQAAPGGLVLSTVYEHGAAHLGGLSAGDLLIAAAGLRVSDGASLERILAAHQVGDSLQVHVFRRDELRSYQLRLQAAPAIKHRLRRRGAQNRRVVLDGLCVDASIGMLDHERQNRQPLQIYAEFELSAAAPVVDSDINSVLDYRLLREALIATASAGHTDLLETLTERCAARILADFPAVGALRLRLSKPQAFSDCAAVGVEITRKRADFQANTP